MIRYSIVQWIVAYNKTIWYHLKWRINSNDLQSKKYRIFLKSGVEKTVLDTISQFLCSILRHAMLKPNYNNNNKRHSYRLTDSRHGLYNSLKMRIKLVVCTLVKGEQWRSTRSRNSQKPLCSSASVLLFVRDPSELGQNTLALFLTDNKFWKYKEKWVSLGRSDNSI